MTGLSSSPWTEQDAWDDLTDRLRHAEAERDRWQRAWQDCDRAWAQDRETLRLRSEALDRVSAENETLRATVARVEETIDRVDETKSATIMVSAIRAALEGDR